MPSEERVSTPYGGHVRRSYGRLPLPCKNEKTKRRKERREKQKRKIRYKKRRRKRQTRKGNTGKRKKTEKSEPDDGKEKTISRWRKIRRGEKPAGPNCRTAKTTTSEQQRTGKREKTGKKANRTARKATKATMDEGKFRFCHSPLAALPQAAIFFALRV